MANINDAKKPKSTARKVISTILGIIFVVIVVVAVVIGTYVFNSPSTEGESAEIIKGKWVDKDNNICFTFDKEGNFLAQDTTKAKKPVTIAKGYFKIDEEAKKIKILVLPKERDKSKLDLGEKLKFFSTINYSDLNITDIDAFDNSQKDDSSCKFIVLESNDEEHSVFECKRTDTLETFYGDKKNEDLKH